MLQQIDLSTAVSVHYWAVVVADIRRGNTVSFQRKIQSSFPFSVPRKRRVISGLWYGYISAWPNT